MVFQLLSGRVPVEVTARVVGDKLFGRGSIDDKSLGIAHLVSFLRFCRRPSDAHREVIFLAVSGEEDGGMNGLAWLLETHPELFDGVEAVLTEDGAGGRGGQSQ